ncbi:MAG: BatD family protein [Spirosomaceae bacterium]|nr:BatD family protein [Spirosomataceae bacterium]
MSFPKVHILLTIALLTFPVWGWSQQGDVSVSYGKTTIELDEKFTIKIVIRAKEYEVSDFPQIDGFNRAGRSVAHVAFKKNGVRGIEHTITQSYIPKKSGAFKLSPTSIIVNNVERSLPGEIINVLSSKSDETYVTDSLRTEIITLDAKEDAQLIMNVSKESVFVGQGFKVTVGFYVADVNTVGWDFPNDLNAQVEAMAQAIKPANCLETRRGITNITAQRTRINGRGYTQYTVFEATYYPLNTTAITIKPVTLNMLKTGTETEDIKRGFLAKAAKVSVMPLPEHPLKDKVPVGNFSVREWLTNGETETGVSVPYEFRIMGEGNFATVNLPTPENDALFDFYPSEVKNNIQEGSLNGERIFKFMIFPKDSGTISLDNYFSFIYFNTNKAAYDTLTSSVTLRVSGEKISSASRKQNDIYDGLENINSADIPVNYRIILKNLSNVLIISMIIALLYMMRKSKTG